MGVISRKVTTALRSCKSISSQSCQPATPPARWGLHRVRQESFLMAWEAKVHLDSLGEAQSLGLYF